jgi:NADP-dependent 3-hydroxy acid dehydrogenase YdfG
MTAGEWAWITGASSGIGAALARRLAEGGRPVAISARRADALAEIAASAANLRAFPCDVTDAAAVAATVGRIEAEAGPIGLAVLNAGTYWPTPGDAFSAGSVKAMLAVNLDGVLHGLDAVLPRMLARRRGHVAIVSSLAGFRGLPTAGGYCAGKAALIALAESLRLDLQPKGIKVQLIAPGFVETPLTAKNEFPMPDIIPAARAAELIERGLASQAFTIAFPRRFAAVMRLLRLLPDALYFRLAGRLVRA